MATVKKLFFAYMGVGPMNPVVYKAASSFLKDYMEIGAPEVIEKYQPCVQKLSEETAKLLNCNPSEIIYTKNTSDGLLIASEALPLKKGDTVLILGNEYPSSLIPWLKKKKDGINVEVIGGKDNAKGFQELLSRIDKKTKAVAISWGQHYDGYMTDLTLLSKKCRANGTYLVVDAVQGIGARVLDLKKVHIDFLASGGQKYLGAIGGFMYVNKKIMNELNETRVSIRSVESFDENGYVLKKTAARFQDGTESLITIVALHAALKEVNRIGIKNIEKKNLKILKELKSQLRANNIPFIDHKNQGNIVALPVHDAVGLGKYLRKHKMYIRPVKGVARISFTYSTNPADFKPLIKKVKEWMENNQ